MNPPSSLSENSPIILSFDVLILVMRMLEDRHDVLSLMKSCKELHDAGVPYLLRLPISIDDWCYGERRHERFEGFLDYCQKYPSRLRYIEEVEAMARWFSSYQRPEKRSLIVSEAFTYILKHCSEGLRTLSFRNFEDGSGIRSRDQRVSWKGVLPTSLVFNHLRVLKIINIRENAIAMLKGLKAPLTVLSLSFDPQFWEDHDYFQGELLDPIPLIMNFQSTIEELTLVLCKWCPRWDASANTLRHQICCPRLHTLRAEYDETPNIASLMCIFPNLRKLVVLEADGDANDIQERMANIESQRQLVRSRRGKSIGWSALDELEGHAQSLYNLALQQNMRVVKVKDCCGYAGDFRFLHNVLEDTKPEVLVLGVVNKFNYLEDDPDMPTGRISTQKIQFNGLVLDVFEGNFNACEDPATTAEHIIGLLQGVSTRNLHLSIRQSQLRNPAKMPALRTTPDFNPLKDYLKLHREAFMGRILDELPSLEYLSVSFGTSNGDPAIYWDHLTSWRITCHTAEDGVETKAHENLTEVQFREYFEQQFGFDLDECITSL
ncbi:hypothetical protein C8Q75DRAFT_810289 [Abortiporus biennis]|nr:hypothetical protein C8Q75DRAFT_810289 [Abortiporus biennis]